MSVPGRRTALALLRVTGGLTVTGRGRWISALRLAWLTLVAGRRALLVTGWWALLIARWWLLISGRRARRRGRRVATLCGALTGGGGRLAGLRSRLALICRGLAGRRWRVGTGRRRCRGVLGAGRRATGS